MNEEELRRNHYISAFGQCAKELRLRLYLTQDDLNNDLKDSLRRHTTVNYWCKIENNRYEQKDWETVCYEMAKILKERYEDFVFHNIEQKDICKPYWIDGVIELKGKYPIKKLEEWREQTERLRLGCDDITSSYEYQEMMYWYQKAIRFILEKTKCVIADLERYSGVKSNTVYRIFFHGYYKIRNPLETLFKLNEGLTKLLEFNGYNKPYWMDFMYENDLKNATKHIRKWYIKMLDKEAKSVYENGFFRMDFDK